MATQDLYDTGLKVKKNRLPQNPEAKDEAKAVGPGRFPSWLHRSLPKGSELLNTGKILGDKRLNTVCEEAKCPNLLECWSKKTATFLIMGKECTRNCGFCDIAHSKTPPPLEEDEPKRIAESVKLLGLTHVVITMVARDDLEDGGANHLALVIREIRKEVPGTTIEVLTSDFQGNKASLDSVMKEKPEIFNYNTETVRELTPRVRHKATYDRTLSILSYIKEKYGASGVKIKSGLMVGLGETTAQVFETLRDLKAAGVDIITIGQYLQPNKNKLLVKAFITPEQFKEYEEYGYSIGIPYMYSGPFVRSSYNAGVVLNEVQTISSR